MPLSSPPGNGYYWVRDHHGWFIAYYDDDSWSVCGNDETYHTSDFAEIGEAVDERKETPPCNGQ